uniref:Putative pentatricopeptide repeat-containing protein, mitochondrial-like n=1 Tax=Solanum chacoense TaxID=4108 RepID=A0A0V0IVU4_SOLCH
MHKVVDLLVDGYLNLKVSVEILNLFLRIYTKNANVELCLLVFEKMLRNEMLPDVKNCNRILRNLRDRNLVAKAREVYKMMGEFGIMSTIITYNTMLDLFCREGEVEQALDLLSEMERRECYPNDVTYNILINGLSKKGEFNHARGLIGEMLNKGLEVSAHTYNPLIYGYCVKGMVVEALSLGEEMEVRGASPTVSTYNTFIYALCRQGQASEARYWFSVMLKKNLVPDIMSYNTLIYGYCQWGILMRPFPCYMI